MAVHSWQHSSGIPSLCPSILQFLSPRAYVRQRCAILLVLQHRDQADRINTLSNVTQSLQQWEPGSLTRAPLHRLPPAVKRTVGTLCSQFQKRMVYILDLHACMDSETQVQSFPLKWPANHQQCTHRTLGKRYRESVMMRAASHQAEQMILLHTKHYL